MQDVSMMTFLMENEAELNCVDQKKRSALMLACINGNRNITDLLLRAGADPKLKDSEGFTALSFAKLYDHKPCADLVQQAIRSGSGRELSPSLDSLMDVAYDDIQYYEQGGRDEVGASEKQHDTSLSDNVVYNKPPLPPGVISSATSNNSRTTQSNVNNNISGPENLFRLQGTTTTAEDETGEEILDLISSSDPNEESPLSKETNTDDEVEDDDEDEEEGENFIFLHELTKREFDEQAVLSDSSYVSDLIGVDLIGSKSVHFAQSTVGSALDLTRKPLELESKSNVYQAGSPVRQDRVPSISSPEVLASPDALSRSEHSLSSRSDLPLSEQGSSLLRGQRPSPDGGTVTSPSPPAPPVTVNSVASPSRLNASATDASPHERKVNGKTVTEAQGMRPGPVGSKTERIDLLHSVNDEEDSWKSDTDSRSKEELRRVEADIGRKIREHSNEEQTSDDWDSESNSRQSPAMHGDTRNTPNPEPNAIPNLKTNEVPSSSIIIGPLKQAIEWDSDLDDDNSVDSEGEHPIPHTQGESLDGHRDSAEQPKTLERNMADMFESPSKSDGLSARQKNKNLPPTEARSTSAKDSVVVTIQSAGSDDEDSGPTNLSPIAEVEEEVQAFDDGMNAADRIKVGKANIPEVSFWNAQKHLHSETNQAERTGSEKVNHQTVLLSTSNRYIDNDMTDDDVIPIIDVDGPGPANQRGATRIPTPHVIDAGQTVTTTRNASTLNGVPTFSELPEENFRNRLIPPRHRYAVRGEITERNGSKPTKIVTDQSLHNVQYNRPSGDDYMNLDGGNFTEQAEEEDGLATENEIITLDDLDEHDDKQNWPGTDQISKEIDDTSEASNSISSRYTSVYAHFHCLWLSNLTGFLRMLSNS
ncbi:unnamed protein product [Echinostoma caproni]|uniref:ANK_REP_REGION domain-containing protein n=1 Tax=Echinostoma caproni TaxID=27848 RepID=A0A183AEF7_9TREM|nr:unnamed protein product [Echinostoma caproni]